MIGYKRDVLERQSLSEVKMDRGLKDGHLIIYSV